MGHRRRADHWSDRAKNEGFAARSVFKLEEIQKRFQVLPRNGRVLDLGCAPGSWTSFAKKVGGPDTVAVGVDLGEVPGYLGTQLVDSVHDVDSADLLDALGGPADLVLSDMAPLTSGNRFTDHVRQIELAERARELAAEVLRPGGHFVVKIFDGADAPDLVARIRSDYEKVRRLKPKATRRESVEFFVVGLSRKAVEVAEE